MTETERTKLLKLELLFWGFWKEQGNQQTYAFMPNSLRPSAHNKADLLIKSNDNSLLVVDKYQLCVEGNLSILKLSNNEFYLKKVSENNNRVVLTLEDADGKTLVFENVTVTQPELLYSVN
jgi:SOS-response transcriptional repressor LexA